MWEAVEKIVPPTDPLSILCTNAHNYPHLNFLKMKELYHISTQFGQNVDNLKLCCKQLTKYLTDRG